MRVFLTGATGYVGSRVANLLIEAGHEVIGLARSDASAQALHRIGVAPKQGSLRDTATLTSAVQSVDAVVHTAFDHDLSRFGEAVQTDRAAVLAMLDGLSRPGTRFILSSGSGILGDTGKEVIDDAAETAMPVADRSGRAAVEHLVVDYGRRNKMHCAVVRLPLFVYGHGGSVFVPALFKAACKIGYSGYVGAGANLYSAVHVDDAATLYRIVLENAELGGTLIHAAAENGVSAFGLAQAVGVATERSALSIDRNEATTIWGDWLAAMMAINNQTASSRARSLGWRPVHEGSILNEIAKGSYRLPPP
ncbi:NAD-dependent epimerase/dehydratase family protein [Sandaracinobacteroides saxicola]|uniref:NAD-dependent epimerase/dehydratase family protein n=1 Tax=Sandaracinobacteroides saxicola TaxID=2759707 RepID=A0A7G5IIQ6_9SPHN|nr:NAD-dependent epimerase/dehydratase family protein [Sandaracinobacteroides saxicola]QMW23248.1 NAD-dependent epimerase/dehydratase family protein [Sandaracinobacteroides saxicola]